MPHLGRPVVCLEEVRLPLRLEWPLRLQSRRGNHSNPALRVRGPQRLLAHHTPASQPLTAPPSLSPPGCHLAGRPRRFVPPGCTRASCEQHAGFGGGMLGGCGAFTPGRPAARPPRSVAVPGLPREHANCIRPPKRLAVDCLGPASRPGRIAPGQAERQRLQGPGAAAAGG